jgi:hypothetical protein
MNGEQLKVLREKYNLTQKEVIAQYIFFGEGYFFSYHAQSGK